MRISTACLVGMLLFPCLARAECVGPNEPLTVEGQLAIGHFHDAADRPETALILTMASRFVSPGRKRKITSSRPENCTCMPTMPPCAGSCRPLSARACG
jgi:hypothetical protein